MDEGGKDEGTSVCSTRGALSVTITYCSTNIFDDRAVTGHRISSKHFESGARSSVSGNAEARRWHTSSRPSLCAERPRWRYNITLVLLCVVETSARSAGERNGAVRQLLSQQACRHSGVLSRRVYATNFNLASRCKYEVFAASTPQLLKPAQHPF